MQEIRVEFLERPTVGNSVWFNRDGQRYRSSRVEHVSEHPHKPGYFLVATASGSTYLGHVQPPAGAQGQAGRPPSPILVGPAGMRWAGPDQTISVGGRTLVGPMAYWSNDPSGDQEASCINQRLRVDWAAHGMLAEVGYYPTYAGLDSGQRAYYLRWLASGRKSPLADIGYAFIFFYGLERRALAEGQDVALIAGEVVRLLNTYTESRSFAAYLGRFLRHLIGMTGLKALKPDWYVSIFRDTLKRYDEEILAVALAWLHEMQAPLPSWLAFQVAKLDPRSQNSIVLKRIPDDFRELFRRRYRQQFGQGMALRASARPLALPYYRANPSLLGWQGSQRDCVHLPHVMGAPSQFSPLVDIWSECIDELRAYSRQSAGDGATPHTRQAFRLLPPELSGRTEHPDAAKWQKAVAPKLREDGVAIVNIGELAPLVECERREKMTLAQSIELAQTASDVGYLLLPDCRDDRRSYRWEQRAVISRSPGDRAVDSAMLKAALTILELGMSIAAADGQLLEDELVHLDRLLQSQFQLSTDEAKKLHALRVLLELDPPSVAELLRGLNDKLQQEQRATIGQYLVAIASIDGAVTRQEAKALAKVYSALELPLDSLHATLAGLAVQVDETVEVRRAEELAEGGEPLPRRTAEKLVLNEERLVSILADTRQVALILNEALAEPEASAPPSPPPAAPTDTAAEAAEPDDSGQPAPEPSCVPVLGQLEERYRPMLSVLLSRPEWPRDEFAAAARANGLMPASAVEVINAWADEYLGDFLIEEGETYGIKRSLMENGTA